MDLEYPEPSVQIRENVTLPNNKQMLFLELCIV